MLQDCILVTPPPSPPRSLGDAAWGRTTAVAGIAALASYGLLLGLPAPLPVQVLLVFGFAFGLTVASLGLYHAVAAPVAPRLALVATVANVVAAGQLTAMLLVQLAVREHEPAPGRAFVAIWLGLDVAWDLYVGVGTLAFAWCMLRHPGFRYWIAVPGIAIALVLLGLNVLTFPLPPGDAGAFDAGPLVGLWYLVVTVRVAWLAWRSRSR
jgi:hypothetical protein